ncbi:MAG: hypothetical protein SCL54_17630 [Bacillota bacterium]|nr:hypothetical protein [Bacillota bacterium]MDW7670474.1 hypothetical protein [Bacillota bacterium]
MFVVLPMIVVLVLGLSVSAFAAPAEKENPFVCPSVSLNNPNGMWVLGDHGAYYVLIPTKGGANEGSRIFVNIPEKAMGQAQVAAGKSLYKKYFSYPNFVSGPDMNRIILLEEGLKWLPGAPETWMENDVLGVMDMDGSYMVHNMGSMMDMMMDPEGFMDGDDDKEMLTIDEPIPLYSAVFW